MMPKASVSVVVTVEVVKQKKSLDKQAPGSKNTMDPLDILRNWEMVETKVLIRMSRVVCLDEDTSLFECVNF